MTSRRATLSLVQASALSARNATPARVRATAQLALRQQYYHQQARPQPAQRPRHCLIHGAGRAPNLPNRVAAIKLAPARAYSTDAKGAPHKIWDFEAVQKLAGSPNRPVTIIDVREPLELQQTGRIPGALNIPITSAPDSLHISADEFEDRFGYPRPPPNAEVVFYCRAGVRSRAAAGLAKDAGWTKVGEYPGSWLDWVKRGGKVEQ